MKWVEEAKSFSAQHEKGMSFAEIAEKANVSESKVKDLIETHQSLRDIPRGTELEYPVAHAIYFNAWRNLWLVDAEEELSILVNYVLEKKLDAKETNGIIFNLLNFYTLELSVKERNEILYNELRRVYYPYRYNGSVLKLIKKERDLRTGSAKPEDQLLSTDEYPTKESAEQYASKYHGELLYGCKIVDNEIEPIYNNSTQEVDGWIVYVIPYTLEEIREELAKKRMKP